MARSKKRVVKKPRGEIRVSENQDHLTSDAFKHMAFLSGPICPDCNTRHPIINCINCGRCPCDPEFERDENQPISKSDWDCPVCQEPLCPCCSDNHVQDNCAECDKVFCRYWIEMGPCKHCRISKSSSGLCPRHFEELFCGDCYGEQHRAYMDELFCIQGIPSHINPYRKK